MGCAAAVGWSPAEYVPRTAQGPLELIQRGFADQITIYIAIVVAAHAYQYFERLRRIGEALDRASRRAKGERAAALIEALPQLQRLSRAQYPRIAIKAKGRILFINPGEVVAVQAEGNYVLLRRESGWYFLRESISEVAEKLKPYGFIRIHRSVLVNASFVEEIRPQMTGEYGLRVKGGREYTVTRTYKRNLKSLADFWIGGGTFLED
jgi:DNA-binding LytR/AlgR family response regulator